MPQSECLVAAKQVGFNKNLVDRSNVGDWDCTPCHCFLVKLSDGSEFIDYDTSTYDCKLAVSTSPLQNALVCYTKKYQLVQDVPNALKAYLCLRVNALRQ